VLFSDRQVPLHVGRKHQGRRPARRWHPQLRRAQRVRPCARAADGVRGAGQGQPAAQDGRAAGPGARLRGHRKGGGKKKTLLL